MSENKDAEKFIGIEGIRYTDYMKQLSQEKREFIQSLSCGYYEQDKFYSFMKTCYKNACIQYLSSLPKNHLLHSLNYASSFPNDWFLFSHNIVENAIGYLDPSYTLFAINPKYEILASDTRFDIFDRLAIVPDSYDTIRFDGDSIMIYGKIKQRTFFITGNGGQITTGSIHVHFKPFLTANDIPSACEQIVDANLVPGHYTWQTKKTAQA